MSAKRDGIDLNIDAFSGDRENEGDATGSGDSVAETLTETCTGQGQGSEVEKVRVFDSARVICDLNFGGSDVNLNSEGVDRGDVLDKVENEVKKGSGYLDSEVHCKCGDDVKTVSERLDRGVDAKDEQNNGKCKDDASMNDEKEVEKGNELLGRGVVANADENNAKRGEDVSTDDENEVEKGSEPLHTGVEAKVEENSGKCGEDVVAKDEKEVEKGSELLDRGVDSKAGENNGKCGEDVSVHDEIEVEEESEHLDRGVDAKAKEKNGKCGEDVSTHDDHEEEDAPVALRPSREAEPHCNTNVGPVGEEWEKGVHGGDMMESLHQKLEEAASDELKNKAMEIDTETESDVLEQETNGKDRVQSLHQKFEAATSDGLENQAMEVDIQTQLECNRDQVVDVPVSEVQDSCNVLNESHAVNLVVDLHPYMAKDGNASSEVNAKSVITEFCEGDLVWGKVRSHPWWPGQIFNLSAASQKAKKYFRKDSYLIAYFGDHTFAWNEASKIKPFQEHFKHMQKQTSLEDFHYAVDCALEEIARRVEFGLACSCIPEEAYAKIKTQTIVNAGILKESSVRDGGDRFSNAATFEPGKLSKHIKALARLPYNSDFDRLELAILKAQLSAFYRWKGYSQLPEFNMLGELLESEAEIPLLDMKYDAELTQGSPPDFSDDKKASSKTGKLKNQDGSSHKRKRSSANSIRPNKKEKSLSDLLAERCANKSNGKRGTADDGNELILLSSGKKHKSVDSISDDKVVKHEKLDSISDDISLKHKKSDMLVVKHGKAEVSGGAAHKCLPMKKPFGIGNSILKVASQLNGSSPIFKSGDEVSQKTVVKNKSREKSLFRNSQSKKQFPLEETSLADLLSQLCLAARNPMERYKFCLISLVNFFADFRDSVSLKQSQEEISGVKTGKTWNNSETTETSESEPMKDTYWTDRVIQNVGQEQQTLENKNDAEEDETPSQKDTSSVEPVSTVQLSARLESSLQTAGENFEQEAEKPADPLGGCCDEDLSPTALILNFTDMDSVPSKDNLNEIFSRFGPVNELETEVKKSKRAKVVFKRRADAETAFSSAGKYSIFGPSLVSYCLKYMPSMASKNSSCTTKQGQKAAITEEENAT